MPLLPIRLSSVRRRQVISLNTQYIFMALNYTQGIHVKRFKYFWYKLAGDGMSICLSEKNGFSQSIMRLVPNDMQKLIPSNSYTTLSLLGSMFLD